MFFRAMTLAGALAGAAAFSQFPEYYQQYTQRLAGAVDELTGIVDSFDADAARLEMSREEALAELSRGGAMAAARALSMRRVFDRYEKLSNDLSVLRSKPPMVQVTQAWRMTDVDVAHRTWNDFKPAVPVTWDGIGFGVAGFLAGLGMISGWGAILRVMLRRRRVSG